MYICMYVRTCMYICMSYYIIQISSLSEFDDVITVPTFGYSSSTEYYADASLTKRLNDIKVPYLCLMSSDDPFAPLERMVQFMCLI